MNMKSAFLASAAIAGIPIGSALASDLPPPARMPVKAAPIVAPPFNWTGFYVGGNVGILWGHSVQTVDIDDAPIGIPPDDSRFAGIIGGVQAGYNWQFSNIVLGVEADIDLSSASKSVTTRAPFDTHNMRVSALGTGRGRVGIAFDRLLPYVTGGVAWAKLKNELIDTLN
ncbi:MAG: outer membrane protein, partial [Pseudolabrys sp.]